MSVKTILWPTDLSRYSRESIDEVVSLSTLNNAKVIVLYSTVDLCSYFPAYGNYPDQDRLNDFRDWEIERARKALNKLCEEELRSCPLIEIKLTMGDPVKNILELAKKENVDLIVISSHGLGREKKSSPHDVIGSITDQVIKLSPVSVHVVKNK
ncbi:universal stress protein [Maridesulfovibrio sp.]|uniref:universal stress protein n=1 Tax=Maridesulfovibrio sp. TaxID=2795000 RepID=UPI0029F526A2|nr:universal stress protein [Maridesulfovibrio sp.]